MLLTYVFDRFGRLACWHLLGLLALWQISGVDSTRIDYSLRLAGLNVKQSAFIILERGSDRSLRVHLILSFFFVPIRYR